MSDTVYEYQHADQVYAAVVDTWSKGGPGVILDTNDWSGALPVTNVPGGYVQIRMTQVAGGDTQSYRWMRGGTVGDWQAEIQRAGWRRQLRCELNSAYEGTQDARASSLMQAIRIMLNYRSATTWSELLLNATETTIGGIHLLTRGILLTTMSYGGTFPVYNGTFNRYDQAEACVLIPLLLMTVNYKYTAGLHLYQLGGRTNQGWSQIEPLVSSAAEAAQERLEILNRGMLIAWSGTGWTMSRGRSKRIVQAIPQWIEVPESDGTIDTEVDRTCDILMKFGLTQTTVYDTSGAVIVTEGVTTNMKGGGS